MTFRCFAIDNRNLLVPVGWRRALRIAVGQEVWPGSAGPALRLVTARLNRRLQPLTIALLRLRLTDGLVTAAALGEARRALDALPDRPSLLIDECHNHPALAGVAGLAEGMFQLSGWPSELHLRRQLALALDVPIGRLPDFRLGGPLLELATIAQQAIDLGPAPRPNSSAQGL